MSSPRSCNSKQLPVCKDMGYPVLENTVNLEFKQGEEKEGRQLKHILYLYSNVL